MNILKDKQFKDSETISRYTTFPFYYHTIDKKYIYGLTKHLDKNIQYVAHKILPTDNLDSLALKYYGRPDLFWVIADFNNIQDPYIKLIDQLSIINIPSISSIAFID